MEENKTKILAIDDEETIRLLMKAVLESHGYEVVTAESTTEGIKSALSSVPDLILTDIRMPGLDGLAFLRRIRSLISAETLPIIVVSGCGQDEDVARGFEAGATDYLLKPFDFTELLARVQIALKQRIDPDNIRYRERPDETVDPDNIGIGTVIDKGKYGILHEVGHGGMGTIYLAEHLGYGLEVALKILHPELAGNKENVLRFLREVRIATSMDHENIVRVYDVGTSGGLYYYAMESLPQHSLRDEVHRSGPLAEDRAAALGLQAASALAYMHRQGVLHRDVKPDNIMFTEPGEVKLIDFGLATTAQDERLTQEGTFMGTPGYVAPEHICDYVAPTARGDMYALGSTLYYAVSGQTPFDHKGGITEKLSAQVLDPVRPLAEVGADVSREFASCIERLLSRDPDERFPSMDAVVERFQRLVRRHGSASAA